MKKIISSLLIIAPLFLKGQPPANQDHLSNNISISTDVLKWKMYVLSFTYNLEKRMRVERTDMSAPQSTSVIYFQTIKDSVFKPVECDINISSIVNRGDTLIFYMDFFKNNLVDKYLTTNNRAAVGVGYILSKNAYYPIYGEVAYEGSEDFFAKYFKEAESRFIAYLQGYKGPMSLWLKTYAGDKGVLK